MYIDKHQNFRDTFEFKYRGDELLAVAQERYKYYSELESSLRIKIADMYNNKTISSRDRVIDEMQMELESVATDAEKCAALAHEFSRSPTAEYVLKLSDVVYFNLHSHIIGKCSPIPKKF